MVLSGWGQLLGWVCAVVFIWILLASGSAWIMGAGRAQAAACLDGGGPRQAGPDLIAQRGARDHGPGLRRGLLAGHGRRPGRRRRDNQKYFSAALVVSIALIVLAYLLIFPAFVALRLREPGLNRAFRVPGGVRMAWLVTGLATGWSLLAAVCLLWPGLGTADPDAALPAGFASQRGQFELLVLIPIGAVIGVTTVYYLATRRRSRDRQAAPR